MTLDPQTQKLVERCAAAAPELTSAQVDELRRLIGPGSHGVAVASAPVRAVAGDMRRRELKEAA